MNIIGTLKLKKKEEIVSDKFKKREFVIVDNSSQYPQFLSFQLTQAKTDLIDNFREGDQINVHFNLRGREWTSPQGELRYFNTLEAWRIEAAGPSAGGSTKESAYSEVPAASETDDLPF